MAKLWRQPSIHPPPLRPGGKVWLRNEEPRPIRPTSVPRAQVGGGEGREFRDTFRNQGVLLHRSLRAPSRHKAPQSVLVPNKDY